MEEENKEREFVDGVNIDITDIEVIESRQTANEVKQIRFTTEKGDITYKPKTVKCEFQNGLKVRREEPTQIDELPENLREMSKAVNTSGTIKVTATYHVWNTTKDGSPATYRYIQGANMFEKWKLVAQAVPEEVVQ